MRCTITLQRSLSLLGACASSLFGIPAHADSGVLPGASPSPEDQPDPSANGSASPSGLTQVIVTGVRPLLHDKLSEDQQSTPQSITVVSNQLMASQADNRLEDALKNVPG